MRCGFKFILAEVVIGPGNKLLTLLPILAILKPGDEVIYSDSGFPSCIAAIENPSQSGLQ
jgi:aspartate/methionine/tyrosine aminotransferase